MLGTKNSGKTKVRIVEGALVASFTGCDGAAVWRADLARLHDASFVLEPQDGGKTAVCLKEAGGRREALAVFDTQVEAEEAFSVLSRAMFSGSSGGLPQVFGRRLLWVLSAVLVLVLFLSVRGGGDASRPTEEARPAVSSAPLTPADIPPRPGVPLSADDVFGK